MTIYVVEINGMSNARDTTLQTALVNNEVIYHKTRIDFPFSESMQITQVYNKKSAKVLCCEIPWDVASQRTGKNTYTKKDECIMLWPDKSLDLYNTRQMRWIGKICDVGDAFNIVWTQFWEYHGLGGEERVILTEGFKTKLDQLKALYVVTSYV